MLFDVRMDVAIPHDLDPDLRARLLAEEQARALELQRSGAWLHLWRVVGQCSNPRVNWDSAGVGCGATSSAAPGSCRPRQPGRTHEQGHGAAATGSPNRWHSGTPRAPEG